jgi:ribosomal protein L37AE/L43A
MEEEKEQLEKQTEKVEIKKTRCPNCNSAFTYVRLGKKQLVCRTCSNITDLNLEEIKK